MKKPVLASVGHFDVVEVPTPVPGNGEVLVKVTCCGICGSDLHIYNIKNTPLGVTPGHEWAGTVEAVGKEVSDWKAGDRAVLLGMSGSNPPLSVDFIKAFLADPASALAGHKAVNAGGFGEYILLKPENLLRIPEHVTDEEAALADTIGVAVGAIENSPMKAGDSVMIVGGGAIGLSTIIAAKVFGASKVIVSEPVAERRELAKKLGADEVFDPSSSDIRVDAMLKTGGGAAVVFDCVGNNFTIQQSVDMVKIGGTVMIVGMSVEPAEIKPLSWMVKQVTVKAQMKGNIRGGLDIIAQGKMPADLFITDRVRLEDINLGFEKAKNTKNQIKVYICFE